MPYLSNGNKLCWGATCQSPRILSIFMFLYTFAVDDKIPKNVHSILNFGTFGFADYKIFLTAFLC
ncbi:Hypothetical protein Ccan_09500 [Capnocytophaga canimorsus Cc5]|uniref:Uncharacterized protein n=1 Tax=Capnocytophaga canimorsus (strain 5) TaxID=860228 RepID=F9YUU3_CAPCC|nr:Hypothetical protein Ccan_09500 [Capnocytophaga canimorsus Cc5]